ncbi:MAG: hypothetical protein QOJ13_3640 [Gaiellales bacterium]|jgi:hypothetical protein|nr:hypothetical protein [Gaiellales bacterium]
MDVTFRIPSVAWQAFAGDPITRGFLRVTCSRERAAEAAQWLTSATGSTEDVAVYRSAARRIETAVTESGNTGGC